MDGTSSLPVDVFGDDGQQREVAECPDDRDRLVDIDTGEHLRDLGPLDLRAPHFEGRDPGPLHQIEDLVAVLLAHRVAQDGTE